MTRCAIAGIAVAVAVAAGTGAQPGSGPASSGPRRDVTILAGRPAVPVTAARPAVDWCGGAAGPSPVNRSPEVEVSSPFQVHVVYAVPADGTDQLSAYASSIASDAAAIDGWWQRQDPTRTLRFDLFPFPSCASRFGLLDIGFARLPHEGAYYLAEDRDVRLINDLASFAGLTTQKTLVYYDGPTSPDNVCGTAYVAPGVSATQGGPYGFVFVWLRSACPNDLGQGRFTAAVAAHELIHSLDALWQPGASHVCPSEPGHVCDSTTDVLYPFAAPTMTLDGQLLDANHDDYYGHSGTWFDVQDSAWLIHLPQFPLTISVAGSGGATGAVEVATGARFSCTQTCSMSLDNGLGVVLTAQPAQGSRLVAWSGACSGAAACSLRMDGAKSVAATFAPKTFQLSVSVAGKGKVVSTPGGIACPGRCSAAFSPDHPVFLQPRAARGYRFAGWSGVCRGTVSCSVRVDRARSVRATFRALPRKKR